MTAYRDPEEAHRTGAIVVALFTDRTDAEEAMADLRAAGFSADDIAAAVDDPVQDNPDSTALSSAAGAAQGVLSGGIVGGVLGLLGSVMLPGVGPIVAGGMLATLLTGAGLGAAIGGLIGALVTIDVPRQMAEHLERGSKEGGVLVTVRADDRALEARSILRDRRGDLSPSFAGSDLTGVESAGAVAVRESQSDRRWQGRERRHFGFLRYGGPERRLSPV